MTLRTPRRRISPRTKRRCRAIKNFIRRALGSSSQPDIQNYSSTSVFVSVSDLKKKIIGIEEQLNTVSQHCQNLASLEFNLRPTISSETIKEQCNIDSDKETNTKSFRKPETTILYHTHDRYHDPINSKSEDILHDDDIRNKMSSQSTISDNNCSYNEKERQLHYDRLNTIQEREQNLCNRKDQKLLESSQPAYPRKSLRSCKKYQIVNNDPTAGYPEHHIKKRNKKRYLEMSATLTKENNVHVTEIKDGCHVNKNLRNKCRRSELDQEFIADIIKRQYKPVKLFGRRDSDFSQFSAPVCRDQEFPISTTYHADSELCSCCHKDQKHSGYMFTNDLSDIRSICDTRLYSSRKYKHHTKHRKRFENYNDSAMYDIIPVKEKSSPKSRRKFAEDNLLLYDKYKEVPPSPRTRRPRLNLQAQLHTEDDDEPIYLNKHTRHRYERKSRLRNESHVSDMSSEVFVCNGIREINPKSQMPKPIKLYNQDGVGTLGCLQCPLFTNEQTVVNNETTLNTQTTDRSADKTEKTLSEIKDILQSFLIEIKKESSQFDKLDSTPQSDAQGITITEDQKNRNEIQTSGQSYNNNSNFGQYVSPIMQPITNPCCYPILPVCPINCLPNGFVVPSPSCTCATCDNQSKERTCEPNVSLNKNQCTEVTNNETQKLIKEIHKFISQNRNSAQKESFNMKSTITKTELNHANTKILTSRSVGGSSKASKHDAKVGTPNMKSYSKSCEAIGSQIGSNRPYAANVCYSDTILEKASGEEATTIQSSSESNYSSETTVVRKKKENKFTKVLKSIGLFKKSRNEIIEEVSESESTMEVKKPKPRPPFQQHIINYNMHDQEYFHRPSIPTNSYHPAHPPHYEYYGHPARYGSINCYPPSHLHDKMNDIHGKHPHTKDIRSHFPSPHHMQMPPCASYYDPHYGNLAPQVPLCLKEIEVKSIGTQSIRKMSLLQKFTNKMQVPAQKSKEPSQKQSSTQTAKDKFPPNIFDWKKLQAKAMQNTSDPLKFSYKTQKRLAEGDIKMRNAMLKKLFYKRNPFSPRNLLVRTLLGKDRSSFGEPPKMYKPRMFL